MSYKPKGSIKVEDYEAFLSDDCLRDYLNMIRKYPPASQEENIKLIEAYRAGDISMEEVLKRNMFLVVAKVFRLGYNLSSQDKLDYIQSGSIGLMTAIEEFDLERGSAFSTFADFHIKSEIFLYVYWCGKTVRRPTAFIQDMHKYLNLVADYREHGEELPSKNEICSILNISRERLQLIEEDNRLNPDSLDRIINGEKVGTSIGSFIKCGELECQNSLDLIVFQEYLSVIRTSFTKLEYYIFYYRILSTGEKTLQEIGDYFGFTRQNVGRIETQLIARLREMFDQNHVMKIWFLKNARNRYPVEKVKEEPVALEDYALFFFLRDSLTLNDRTILKEILFSDFKFDSKKVAKKLSIEEKSIWERYRSLEQLVASTLDNPEFKLFREKIIQRFRSNLYDADLDADIHKYLDLDTQSNSMRDECQPNSSSSAFKIKPIKQH